MLTLQNELRFVAGVAPLPAVTLSPQDLRHIAGVFPSPSTQPKYGIGARHVQTAGGVLQDVHTAGGRRRHVHTAGGDMQWAVGSG